MRHFFLTPSLSRFEFCSNIFSIWSGKLHVPYYLVGSIPTPLKNMKVSWDDYSHILWKIKNVPNHQPVIYNDSSWRFCWRIFSKTLNRHQGTMYSDISSAHPRDHRTCGEHVGNMWGTCGENVGKMWLYLFNIEPPKPCTKPFTRGTRRKGTLPNHLEWSRSTPLYFFLVYFNWFSSGTLW